MNSTGPGRRRLMPPRETVNVSGKRIRVRKEFLTYHHANGGQRACGRQRTNPDMFLDSFLALSDRIDNPLKIKVVGAARFELTTSCSQSKRSTKLSYAP